MDIIVEQSWMVDGDVGAMYSLTFWSALVAWADEILRDFLAGLLVRNGRGRRGPKVSKSA